MAQIGGIGTAIGDFGGAISDLFGSQGSSAEASEYGKAASLEGQNATLAKAATQLQVAQTGRQVYAATSQAKGAAGANGIALSGSVEDILRSTAQQGSLATSMIQTQGNINVTSYLAEENAYLGQQKEAEALSKGQGAGGILDALGGIASIFEL